MAQAAGIALSVGEQFMIGFSLMLTSKGVAAVPRASLVILIATASTFGFPVWPIMAIYGIDELMDMARTGKANSTMRKHWRFSPIDHFNLSFLIFY
ncbi:MAG TPA: cation:dicarboxylase symporter family transporter [Agriterribacter sp.]|nr:cation:dicarboxylase symporter family transporter [Agriterribacter sp.]